MHLLVGKKKIEISFASFYANQHKLAFFGDVTKNVLATILKWNIVVVVVFFFQISFQHCKNVFIFPILIKISLKNSFEKVFLKFWSHDFVVKWKSVFQTPFWNDRFFVPFLLDYGCLRFLQVWWNFHTEIVTGKYFILPGCQWTPLMNKQEWKAAGAHRQNSGAFGCPRITFVSPELCSEKDDVIAHSVRSMYVVCGNFG